MTSARIPAMKEIHGLRRGDDKRRDSLTLVPRQHCRLATWYVTVADTVSACHWSQSVAKTSSQRRRSRNRKMSLAVLPSGSWNPGSAVRRRTWRHSQDRQKYSTDYLIPERNNIQSSLHRCMSGDYKDSMQGACGWRVFTWVLVMAVPDICILIVTSVLMEMNVLWRPK